MSGPGNVRGQPFHVDRKEEGTSFMIWPEIISFLSTHLYSSISWFNEICFGSMLKITFIQIFCQKRWGWGDIDCSPKLKKVWALSPCSYVPDITITWLTDMEYLCHKWPRICSIFLNHHSSFIVSATRGVSYVEQEF
jgi:hypothetical protein